VRPRRQLDLAGGRSALRLAEAADDSGEEGHAADGSDDDSSDGASPKSVARFKSAAAAAAVAIASAGVAIASAARGGIEGAAAREAGASEGAVFVLLRSVHGAAGSAFNCVGETSIPAALVARFRPEDAATRGRLLGNVLAGGVAVQSEIRPLVVADCGRREGEGESKRDAERHLRVIGEAGENASVMSGCVRRVPSCAQAKEGGRAAALACTGLGALRQWRVRDVPFAASARTRKEGGEVECSFGWGTTW
jgi:hypothetical protein